MEVVMRGHKIIFIILIILIPVLAQGQTYISGSIGSQTWTPAGSPYIITADTWADSLTVEAAVEVFFNSDCILEIEEVFTVNGTETDSVLFSDGNTTWKSITIDVTYPRLNSINYAIFQGSSGFFSWYMGDCLHIKSSNAEINNCTFRNNTCDKSPIDVNGGVSCDILISNCDFYNNTTGGQIGINTDGDILIRNCRFFDNISDGIIAAGYSNYLEEEQNSVIYNCQFFENECQYVISLYKGIVANSIFYETVSPGYPFFDEYGAATNYKYKIIQNCIFWVGDSLVGGGQTYDVEYCDLPFTYPGIGNISADPLFMDPTNGNFNLSPGSPCIDTGNPSGFWVDEDSSRSDMGLRSYDLIIPSVLNVEFEPLWPTQQTEKSFQLLNLHPYNITITGSYLTSPDNFQYNIITPLILEPNQGTEIPITFTCPGYDRSSDLVFTSPQFIINDTASVHIWGPLREFTPVSGIWTAAQSPYCFDEDLIVEDGEQLVIEAGVEVMFEPTRVFQIEGNLQAIGSEEDSIHFTPTDNDDWGGLIFNFADGDNRLEYVIIKEGGVSYPLNNGRGGGIFLDNSQLNMRNCYISDCFNNKGGGFYAYNCNQISMDSCYFEDCYAALGGGFHASNCSEISMDGCYFEYCEASFGGSMYIDNSNIVIDSCTFYRSEIYNNEENENGVALYVSGSDVNITRSLFTYSYPYFEQQSAVLVLDSSSTVDFDHSDLCYHYGNYEPYAVEIIDNLSQINISNSIIYDLDTTFITVNPAQVSMTYSIAPELWPGIGNLLGNPLITEDCELMPNSPCIDAGDPTYPLDPDSSRTDMGAYYYDGSVLQGAVSGIWTAANSPYSIVGDVFIPEGDTLIMLPGTEVEFLEILTFDVYGVLLCQGTEEDPVLISGPFWSRTYFHNASQPSYIHYTHFNEVIVEIPTCSLELYNTTISECVYLGSQPVLIDNCLTGSIYAENSSGNTITNSEIDGGIRYGTDWIVINNYIHDYMSFNVEFFPAIATCVAYSEGLFINNVLNAYASNPSWFASAYGFDECSGEISHNIITSTTGSGYTFDNGRGLYNCSGVARHNCINADGYGVDDPIGEVFNNTIINARYGIMDFSGTARNNIIVNCETGVNGPTVVEYSCIYNCPTPFANGATAGVGTIEEDPLLINTWFLDPNSPCIDAGDPDPFYNDPDGTRDDMGANYFDQGAAYATVSLTPYGTPIQIPATGGSFDFNIAIANSGANQVVGDVWCNVILPNGNLYGPLLGPINLTLPAGFQLDRDRSQTVPGGAPEGTYTYQAFIGLHPETIWDMDSFTFEKLTTGDGAWVEDWSNSGEPFDEWLTTKDDPSIPETYSLEQNYPNPFNPLTTISFALPEAGRVQLAVYNMLGRQVAQLVNGYRGAGCHVFTFDGSGLSSGIYFYRIEAGDFTAVRKMVLVK
ncbi:hypothetical protein CEE37_03630 [candidate division LCP-89 bacterium B3_LCP]|uniref:Secretion system C-terminal sorting domain-containing protein n=1 Tax=candidate division LCP-89 bacterium B3_LCP TaxID=2012998 RepID=A0A532V3E3_UNCL8|nr:MAG: hypothetical protein CEE37_03630 [candidate division LCP-89 bacterium B3_LCP]